MRTLTTALAIAAALTCNTAAAQTAYTIHQLLDSAMHTNSAMRQAQRDVESARLQRKEAFTNFFPSISGTAMTFTANRDMAVMDIDTKEFITPEIGATLAEMLPAEALAALSSPMTMSMLKNGTLAGVNATLPIFAGGQIVNGNRLARLGEEVAQLRQQLTANDVEQQLTTYFWQLAALKQKRNTIQAADSMLATIEANAQAAVEAGVVLRNDLLQVQLRRNEIASNRLKVDNGIALLHLVIAQFCQLSTTDFDIHVPDDDTTEACTTQPLDGAMLTADDHAAVASLPEYRLLEANVRAATLLRRMELGKRLPTIAVGAGYNFHNLLERNRHFGMLFATAAVPITDWWGGSYAIRRKRIAENDAREKLNDNAQLLAIRQHKAANDLAEAQSQLHLADNAIGQAEENMRLQRDTYQAGTTTMSDLLKAQLLLQQALDARTDAIAALNNARLAYRQAMGL